MKSLHELYEEVKAGDELKKALAAAVKADKVTEFLKDHGCDSTAEELKEFVAEKLNRGKPMRELSEDELDRVAGGTAVPNPMDVAEYINGKC